MKLVGWTTESARSATSSSREVGNNRFIETLAALVMQYEDEIEPDPSRSPAGVLKFLMDERGLRQIDHVPIPGSKSYISQILSGHRPISKVAAYKLADHFKVSA